MFMRRFGFVGIRKFYFLCKKEFWKVGVILVGKGIWEWKEVFEEEEKYEKSFRGVNLGSRYLGNISELF